LLLKSLIVDHTFIAWTISSYSITSRTDLCRCMHVCMVSFLATSSFCVTLSKIWQQSLEARVVYNSDIYSDLISIFEANIVCQLLQFVKTRPVINVGHGSGRCPPRKLSTCGCRKQPHSIDVNCSHAMTPAGKTSVLWQRTVSSFDELKFWNFDDPNSNMDKRVSGNYFPDIVSSLTFYKFSINTRHTIKMQKYYRVVNYVPTC